MSDANFRCRVEGGNGGRHLEFHYSGGGDRRTAANKRLSGLQSDKAGQDLVSKKKRKEWGKQLIRGKGLGREGDWELT